MAGMTQDDVDRLRMTGHIETELSIIESIPPHSFGGATSPNLLGAAILRECLANIRKELGS